MDEDLKETKRELMARMMDGDGAAVARRLGITRQTYYQWRDTDKIWPMAESRYLRETRAVIEERERRMAAELAA